MQEIIANFWQVPADVYVITTNGTLKKDNLAVMGRGIARQAKIKFPGIEKELGSEISKYGNIVHDLGNWKHSTSIMGSYTKTYRIFAFPVKQNWWEKADIDLIEKSAIELHGLCHKFNRVLLVRPGCGNGNLKWIDVKPIILKWLDYPKYTIVERNSFNEN